MTRLYGAARQRSLVLVTAFALSALCLYSVSRNAGLIALGIATSAYLMPLVSGAPVRQLLLLWACAAPVLVACVISLEVRDLSSSSPTTAFALIWAANALAYPLLLKLASEPTVATPNLRRVVPATLLGILALAVLVRGIALESLPAPFAGDEAVYSLISHERELGSTLNLFGSGYFGSANLYFQLGSWTQLLPFDLEVNARLLSVGFGVSAVMFTFLFTRAARDTSTALCAAAALALLHAHIHFSRVAMPNIDETTVSAAVLFSSVWALKRGSPVTYGVAGLVLGLAPYAWTTARVLPVVPVMLFGTAITRGPERVKVLQGLAAFASGAFIVAAPILFWWAEHPQDFRTRDSAVFVYAERSDERDSWWASERAAGRSSFEILQGQFDDTIQAVFWGPEEMIHFNSELGMFGPLPSLLFVTGLVVAVRRFTSPEHAAVLGLLGASFIGGGILAIPPVSAARLTGMLVPGAYLMGLGAMKLAGFSRGISEERRKHLALAIIVLSTLPGLAYYFGEWRTEGRYSDSNTRLATEWARVLDAELPRQSDVLWFSHPPVDPGHMTLRLALFRRELMVIDPEGRPTRMSGWGVRPSDILSVVVTGAEAAQWVAGGACSGIEPTAVYTGTNPEHNLVIYEPGEACAGELRRLYLPAP